MRDLISSRLSERPWTWVDMVSRRVPELAWTSWTDFWREAHGGVELVDSVGGLLDEGFLDSVVLSHLGLHVFLTLEERGDIALELDNFASDGEGRVRADEAAGEGADEHGADKERDVTHTHEKASRERHGMKLV